MIRSVWAIAATVITVTCLASLFCGYQRRREERRRRSRGIITIPIGAGHMAAAGCLGVVGYLGLLFVLLSLTFDTEEDLVQNRDGLTSDSQVGSIRGDLKLTLGTYLVLVAAFGAGALYSLVRLLQEGSFGAFGPWLTELLPKRQSYYRLRNWRRLA